MTSDEQIDCYRRLWVLRKGWNGYDAPAPSGDSIRRAILYAREFPSHDVHLRPSCMGGVAVTRRRQGRLVYVEFGNNGSTQTLWSRADLPPEVVPGCPDPAETTAFLLAP